MFKNLFLDPLPTALNDGLNALAKELACMNVLNDGGPEGVQPWKGSCTDFLLNQASPKM